MDRTCPECGDKIIGRADKKYCSSSCRNARNNSQNKDSKNMMRNINNRLRKNYRILEKLNPEEKTKTTKAKLNAAGFDFNYFTSIYTTKAGTIYYFIYDQGYLPLDGDFYALVKERINMKIYAETKNLILREIVIEDTGDMYRLDSDPLVHKYLGNKPISCMGKARAYVDYIRMQYETYGIGRWAAIEKSTGDWIGWTGLKMNFENEMNGHTDFYDIGYRFMPQYWGKGYATESSIAARDYFFKNYAGKKLCGMAELDNGASCRVLEKIGLERKDNFIYEPENIELAWFEKSM